ncbi:SDR family NAD(P)-dependent oxidoreductase [Chitinophaga horti]|uniref:SDR family NAD(P)-dependent oxidoreductase n=1 Tax=Chitinophaga horti TaxID=2920382 RepID=A0ABY6JBN6_9BACT|nr:SDR family NAD(P)-dependent oxidoreductase [Chitinophaga horti]UYQ95807.1 SDR family NAD(P)-dependent oxidoreductase [Chitinophaga horti]
MSMISPIALVLVAVLLGSCATANLSKSGQRKTAGKVFVVTGASSGFGRGVAEELGTYGASVVLVARRTELLKEIAARIDSAGGKALVVTADVSNEDDIQRVTDTAVAVFKKVDVWINNAGVGSIGRFWEIPLAEHSRLIDVNLKGVIYGSYAAIRLFRSQKFGTLINTGSIDSEVPLAYQSSYSASKAGVRSLGQAIHQELRLNNERYIRVVTIMPWAADTPWWRHAGNHSGGTPRMAAPDKPDKVVNAIIYASLHRRKELAVGWKARMSYHSHHMAPHFTEWLSANIAHKYQIKDAPPAPDTSGALFKPMEAGRGIDDGVKKRIKQENRERKRNKRK